MVLGVKLEPLLEVISLSVKDAEQGGLLAQLCPILTAPVCPRLAGP